MNIKVNEVVVDGAEFAQITVSDTGIGMDEQDRAQIFGEFYQPHKTNKHLKKNVDSTGLGLAITKRLIELHGGSILVTSQKGVGSTFVAQFPIRQV